MAKGDVCLIVGCNEIAVNVRGWCGKHYSRWQRQGDPNKLLLRRDYTTDICSVDGCEKARASKGLCQMHALRLKTHGSLELPEGTRKDRRTRWIKRMIAEAKPGRCIAWPFGVNENGRGEATFEGRSTSAPRVVCMMFRGKPPTKKHQAAHTCGKGHEGCVNPHQIVWKTPKQNEADKRRHGTLRKGEDINTAILTEADVRSIRTALAGGESGVSLANRYSVRTSTISAIKTGKTWAWLK